MTKLSHITPHDVAEGLSKGHLTVIDVREKDEYAREHIKDVLHIPLSSLQKGGIDIGTDKQVVFYCRSGNRTEVNCAQLASHIDGDALLMAGGLNGWKTAGLPTIQDRSSPIEINRQVQMTAGSLTVLGIALGAFIHPGFYGLSAFIGAGLTFSGLTGSCAMASVLKLMPWNRPADI